MLKTFQSLTIILFLFSISFLPLTQITGAEAQFSNKIQKPDAPERSHQETYRDQQGSKF